MTSNKHRVLTSHYENDYSRHDDKNYYFSDNRNYDAMRDAMEKFRRNPAKYESESRRETSRQSSHYESTKRSGPVEVVMEHWSGCSNQSHADNIRLAIEDNFRSVNIKEFIGRIDSFELFVNGKIVYSRIMQGGYPYEEEVLDAIWRAQHGKEIYQIDRYGGSPACTLL
ncbi:migration and invasion enhancer 1-like [Dreissena polymorpha]|uniref:migration and invasion enhancer 1-like n=1 Tax=Dreissena polymorpha TaxID=45954 RepID=UPI002265317D|nr:migration and invasion enhancer 1-like [Dreissena polymorpha]